MESILISVFAKVMGLQFWMRVRSSSFLGMRMVWVFDHDGGGDVPFVISLNMEQRICARGVMNEA